MEAAPGSASGSKGLKIGALGLLSTLVIGVASVAPAYSLAASLGFVTGSVGFLAPSIMVLAFIPMLFIAAAYYYMNRADPDCGTTFTWVTRAMGPKSGWIGGWAILVTDLIVMPNLAGIAGSYTFSLFGAYGVAASTFWPTVIGVIWIAVMTIICYIGIELSARTQVGLLGAEIVILVVFAVVALAKVYTGHVAHSVRPSISWINPVKVVSGAGAPGWGALSAGMLFAVFIYWGWDTAVTVNEESKDAKRTPGKAAVLSTLVLLGIYLLVSVAAQAYHGANFLTNNANSGDVLGTLANDVLGSTWGKLLIIAVLTSAAASTQTTILPAARSSLSMSVHKAFPKRFGSISAQHLTPGFATITFGVVSIVWYVVLTWLSPKAVLGNSISALGFGIAFYYGITGYACVFYYRKHLFKSFKNFVMIGLAPLIGAVILTVMFVISIFYYSNPANAFVPGQAWLPFIHFNVHVFGWNLYVTKGLGPPVVLGVGFLLLGLPLMFIWKSRHKEFFQRSRETADSVDASAPPLTPGVTPVTD